MKLHALWTLCLCAPLLAAAQTPTVWRCGADGRSFSDTPCAEGQMLAMAAPRPAEDVQAARALAAQERQQADRLLAERLQREAAAQRIFSRLPETAAAPVKPSAKPVAARKRRAVATAGGGTSRAAAPASRPRKG